MTARTPGPAKRKSARPYWYRIYVGECPVCGKDKGYKRRMYGRPPKRRADRYIHLPDTQTYDHCLEREI